MPNLQSRDYLFDNLKGLLIFCVVYAHFLKATSFQLASPGGAMYCTFFCFIMQGFLFVSGYFSKHVEKCRAKAAESFLFPYVILTVVMYLARVIIFGWDNASLHFIKPSMALWYLQVLFIYRWGIQTVSRIPHILPLSFLISLGAGFIPFLGESFSLGRVFGFLPFFILGYCCKPNHIERLRAVPKWIAALLFLALSFIGTMMAYTGIGWNSILFKRAYMVQDLSLLQGLTERILLTAISLAWIVALISLLPRYKTILSDIGRGTMTVFVLHILIRYVIKDTKVFGEQNWLCYGALFICAAAATYLLSRPVVVHAYNEIMSGLYTAFMKFLRKQHIRIRLLKRKLPLGSKLLL